MKHFIHLKDISSKDLRKILNDAKKRKNRRKKLNTLDLDKSAPLRRKLLIALIIVCLGIALSYLFKNEGIVRLILEAFSPYPESQLL